MADSSDISLDEGSGESAAPEKKRRRLGGLVPGLLKWILIAVGAVILIVVVVVVTVRIVSGNTSAQVAIPASEEYRAVRPVRAWYQDLGVIRTRTSDTPPASVVVNVYLGYDQDDRTARATSAEITLRRVEIVDYLRRYFTLKTVAELRPQNESQLKLEIRNAINDEILGDSKIRDVAFQQLDVLEQQ